MSFFDTTPDGYKNPIVLTEEGRHVNIEHTLYSCETCGATVLDINVDTHTAFHNPQW